jgi:uncharacterized protein (TIGR02145 family)
MIGIKSRKSLLPGAVLQARLLRFFAVFTLLATGLLPCSLFAQTEPSALFEIQSTDKGFLLPRMTEAQRDAIVNPAKGLMIYNTSSDCVDVNFGTSTAPQWQGLSCRQGTINAMNCGGAEMTGALTSGVATNGVSIQVPYTGGNGSPHSGQVATSFGVTGLTATLAAGNFVTGADSVTYEISGMPAATGTACFPICVGGQSCILFLSVDTGLIESLHCTAAALTDTLIAGLPAQEASVEVPYTGGNGGPHSGQVVTSTGVTGLTATLTAGNFAAGTGNLTYAISGTPATPGTASFELSVGGQICTLSLPIAAGSIESLNCSNAVQTGKIAIGVAAAGVSVQVPYTGGNGGAHSGQAVTSTEVTGLTATLAAGNFASGAGNLTYTISGVPGALGTASFALSIGGQSCTINLTVTCGAFISPGVLKEFSCHNLASANTAANPFTPSWEIIGGYWQWGRKGPDSSQWLYTNMENFAHGPAGGSAEYQSNPGTINGWSQSAASMGSWFDGIKAANDPCPAGFKVPRSADWNGVLANNPQSTVGTNWISSYTNYTTGYFFGPALMLPAAGYRNNLDGGLTDRGRYGTYWSSTVYNSAEAYSLDFQFGSSLIIYASKLYGSSIRCIAE